ncbi:MAG: DNA repair protein RadA, partial [Solirubrobacterales bacterium]
MAKARKRHVCSDCGHEALAWQGQCPGCGSWNTLAERAAAPARAGARSGGRGGS